MAGLAKAVQDLGSESPYRLGKLKQSYWHKATSSKNKWKNGDKNQGEKFFGSSTFLVWITDGWHLMDAIRNISLATAIYLSESWWIALSCFILFLITFELIYKSIRD